MTHTTKKGFTLLEILLVIAAIGILAAIVIVAINPGRQLAQARNAQRESDINTISSAIAQYVIDGGTLATLAIPSGTHATVSGEIANGTGECLADAGDTTGDSSTPLEVDLAALISGNYLADLPEDPNETATDIGNGCTGYIVSQNTDGRVTVSAPKAELSETLSIIR